MLFFILPFNGVYSQNHQWSFNVGLNDNDLGQSVYTDNNGFVYVVGYFAGNNIDFDPSPSNTAYLSSNNGSKDGFVAKYTAAGQYVWAFAIGGNNLDEVGAISVDGQGNVYLTGYFRGQGIDFNPSATANALLNSNGENGGDPGYGGDIFIAKYNSSGQYQWAFNVGGSSLGDNGTVIVTDGSGNIYTGGYFNSSADFDPSSSTATLDASNGVVYFAKYNTNGQYQWAFNVGQPNGNSHPFGLKIDASANIYVSGYIIGTGLDFNPSPTATDLLNSNGMHDIFLAKYNSNGQYQWAKAIGGSGSDVARDIDIDNAGNIYLAGDFQNTVDFDPSSSDAILTSVGGSDIFIAKYDNNGLYQWAKRFGSSSSDIAWSVAYTKNNVYLTGGFEGVVNFSPGPAIDNLISNGGRDIYLTKFDVNGNYVCAFSAGGAGTDEAARIDADNAGNLYVTGILSSSSTDFNPNAPANNLTTNGGSDIFIAKYNWPDNPRPTGTIAGNTICNGQEAQLTFTATSGISPFTVEYSDGSTVFTRTNVQSGIPFNLTSNPAATTTYQLISIKDATKCAATNNVSGITATVTVSTGNSVDFSFKQNPCSPKNIQFYSTNSSASSYNWDFGNGSTSSGSSTAVIYGNYGNYVVKLIAKSAGGCIDTMKKTIPVFLLTGNTIFTKDTTICTGTSLKLSADSSTNFCWKPDSSIDNQYTANTTVTPTTNTVYYFTSQVSEGSNLVLNGDFSQGTASFSSEYMLASSNTNAGEYFVGSNPKSWNGSFNNCIDHTTGTGKMLLVNSSTSNGTKIWAQTISITPNTNYAFSAWVQSLSVGNPASLRFLLNGLILNDSVNAANSACQWNRFSTSWNSGTSTTVEIAIVNINTLYLGNDFALDDISFSKVLMKQDSIKINVSQQPVIRTIPDTSICEGSTVSLKTTGGTFYNWGPVSNISNTTVESPIASPIATTRYIVTGYNTPGCIGRDTVNITILPKPVISITKDTTICSGASLQLFSSGGSDYQWAPFTALSSATLSNPVSTTLNSLTYRVTVSSIYGCTNMDSVRVQVAERPKITIINDTSVCKGSPVQLKTNITGPAAVSWSPSTGLSNQNTASPIASPAITTKYIITAVNSGCVSKDSVMLGILPSPVIFLTNDTTLCSGSKLQLNAAGGVSYQWSPSVGLTNGNINNPIASPDSTTSYFVDVKGTNGCSNKDSVIISIAPKPTVSTIANTSVCEGTPLSLITSSSNGVKYNWSPSNGLSDISIASPIASPVVTTNYIITVSTINNCEAKDTVEITVLDKPVVTKSNDTTFCIGASVQIFATGGAAYTWSPSYGLSNTNTYNPITASDSSIVYHVIVSGSNGCSKTDSVKITVRPKPAFNISPATAGLCGIETITLKASGGDEYKWLGIDPVFSPNSAVTLVKPTASSIYSVRIHDSVCNFTDTLSSSITVNPLPKVSIAKSNDIDCSFPSAQLNATGGINYTWGPSLGLNSINISNPVASPSATTFYSVKATDVRGCSAIDSIKVLVKFTGNANGYNMPSAFTPNGDGKNDCFGIKYWGSVTGLEFSIFNRWGERVFSTSNPTGCWDGTYKNVQQNSGTFVYIIKAKTICGGEVNRKGTVVLLR